MSQKRGQLTDRIKSKSLELFGYKIDQKELRLMAYIQYVMMNSHKLDPNSINSEEREILSKWRKKEYMEGGASGMGVTRLFWDNMNELLFLGYVDLYDE